MAAKMSVLGLILSFNQYLRSAMLRFFQKTCISGVYMTYLTIFKHEFIFRESTFNQIQVALSLLFLKQTMVRNLYFWVSEQIWLTKEEKNVDIFNKLFLKYYFNNYRGIFRVTVLRSILHRLIFNDEYENIDQNLTDSSVGGQRGKNRRQNVFVLNATLNSIKSGNKNHVIS